MKKANITWYQFSKYCIYTVAISMSLSALLSIGNFCYNFMFILFFTPIVLVFNDLLWGK